MSQQADEQLIRRIVREEVAAELERRRPRRKTDEELEALRLRRLAAHRRRGLPIYRGNQIVEE